MKHPIVYTGSSNIPLATAIAQQLHGKLADVQISRFSNNEARVFINEEKVGSEGTIVQSLSSPVDEHIVEFGLICDAMQRMGVHDIMAVIPWLGYSKQDKVFRPGESLSVKVIAKILQVVPIKRLYTFDLHNLAILGFFDIPVTNLTARPLFETYFRERVTSKTIIVAPDAGAIKSSTVFATELDVPVAYLDKKRDLASGKVSVSGISRNVEGADVIIVDDMIVTGGTLTETAKYLKSQGVGSISVAATHHLYVPGAEEALESAGIDHIVVTDTVKPLVAHSSLTILSVAQIIAAEIKKFVS
jgi:ribose-phosphate pyrophosphokinase